MRILADENVAGSVVKALLGKGHDTLWIADTAPGSTDDQVLGMACKDERLLLTHDKDLAATAARRNAVGLGGIVLLRLDGIGPDKVAEFVVHTFSSRDDWTGHFSILKSNSIRMRKLR